MRDRLLLWIPSAALALPALLLGPAAGLPDYAVLPLAFIGAIAGSLVGAIFRNRRQAGRPEQ